MARLIIHTEAIKQNIKDISAYLKQRNIEWSLITKVFSGDLDFLEKLLTDDVVKDLHSIGDSRLTSIKNIKEVRPELRTIYIKPPAIAFVKDVVKYADISLNSSYATIKALNEEAGKQQKIHKIIIMIELGELREGIQREAIMDFYEKVLNLENIEVIGIGSNLGCMYGVEPSYDKLLQLALYKELIAAKFSKDLPFISGGTSIALPLLEQGMVPPEINHFRIGEAAFFGVSPLKNEKFLNLNTNTFEFQANIIELAEKDIVPDGIIGEGNIGHTAIFSVKDINQTSIKAILDFGHIDVDRENILTDDDSINFVGITSDMTVIDIGDNLDKKGNKKFKVGQRINFKPTYLGVARLLNSKFIDKIFDN